VITFDVSKGEAVLIMNIARRAITAGLGGNDMLGMEMDITAAHANGCPLDLGKLLNFGDGDFAHDISGIRYHIDRETGKLGDCFLPRCAAPPCPACNGEGDCDACKR
jgi:hypothetical protein